MLTVSKGNRAFKTILKVLCAVLTVAITVVSVIAIRSEADNKVLAADNRTKASNTQEKAYEGGTILLTDKAKASTGTVKWKTADVKVAAASFEFNEEKKPSKVYSSESEKGQEIVEINTRLMELSYMENDNPSDTYAKTTEEAIKVFERKNGFEMDGILTEFEYDILMSDEAQQFSVALGDVGTDVSELQARLVDLGYLEVVTGEFGMHTQTAVIGFQKANGLKADGKIGTETREVLYSDEAEAKALSYGDQNEDIKIYQQKLSDLGYYDGKIDGFFSTQFKNAVKEFQSKNGVIADGMIGKNTRTLILSEKAEPSYYGLGDSGDTVRKIQGRLVDLKYMSGDTGYFGEVTEKAIKAFQTANGISADGKVGKKTMDILFSDKAVSKPATPKTNTQAKDPKTTTTKDKTSTKTTTTTTKDDKPKDTGKDTTTSTDKTKKDDTTTTKTDTKKEETTTKPAGTEATKKADSSKVDELIAVAKSKLGCKYVLGAKGPDQFDCSGFVYWCLNQVGVKQGYMTSYGWKGTTKYPIVTSMGDLQKGDIISYQGHVAIYIGNNQMIDASSAEGKIRITNIYSNVYWKNHFIKGLRIF